MEGRSGREGKSDGGWTFYEERARPVTREDWIPRHTFLRQRVLVGISHPHSHTHRPPPACAATIVARRFQPGFCMVVEPLTSPLFLACATKIQSYEIILWFITHDGCCTLYNSQSFFWVPVRISALPPTRLSLDTMLDIMLTFSHDLSRGQKTRDRGVRLLGVEGGKTPSLFLRTLIRPQQKTPLRHAYPPSMWKDPGQAVVDRHYQCLQVMIWPYLTRTNSVVSVGQKQTLASRHAD